MSQNVPKRGGPTPSFIAAIAAGKPVAEASEIAGKTRRTGSRWLRDPVVKQEVSQIRNELVSGALGIVLGNLADAALQLVGLLQSNNESIRLGATRSMLQFGQSLKESVEMQADIDAIKAKLGMTVQVPE